MSKSTVSIVRCENYERSRVALAVREAVSLLPSADEFFQAGHKVLLKPNLLSANDPPERAVNTHPEFVRAVAEMFMERGCKVYIGDSCGSLSPGSTVNAFHVSGLECVAKEVGAELVNFDHAPTVEVTVPDHHIVAKVRVPRILQEVDLFVTLPKFKTHSLTLLTGAVKNQVGLVPGKGKKELHLAAPKPLAMAQAVLDIYTIARPRLAIMDAILGMEGNGPAAGSPRSVGLILAGNDCVAVDATAAEIMGYGKDEVDTTRFAVERGLGVGQFEEIDVKGLSLAEAVIPDFRKPPRRLRVAVFRFLPIALLRWMLNEVGSTCAMVMDDRCVLCGECIANCPAGALRETKGKIRAEAKLCISCYCCSEVCERRAIVMRRPFVGRLIYGLSRLLGRK